jgi:hypothetical protein
MFEVLRAARRFGRAVRYRDAGSHDRAFELLLEAEALLQRCHNKTSPYYVGIATQVLMDLAREADRRGIREVGDRATAAAVRLHDAAVEKYPHLQNEREFRTWADWVEPQQRTRNLSCRAKEVVRD